MLNLWRAPAQASETLLRIGERRLQIWARRAKPTSSSGSGLAQPGRGRSTPAAAAPTRRIRILRLCGEDAKASAGSAACASSAETPLAAADRRISDGGGLVRGAARDNMETYRRQFQPCP